MKIQVKWLNSAICLSLCVYVGLNVPLSLSLSASIHFYEPDFPFKEEKKKEQTKTTWVKAVSLCNGHTNSIQYNMDIDMTDTFWHVR